MTRLEKCEVLKSKGYTYNPDTGKIHNPKGKEITAKNHSGYIVIGVSYKPSISLYGHHFAWYITYGDVKFKLIDHINKNKSDNRIENLRILTHQQNLFNSKSKGISFHIRNNKWNARICVNRKVIYLGSYDTEDEARQSYLNAKSFYHPLN